MLKQINGRRVRFTGIMVPSGLWMENKTRTWRCYVTLGTVPNSDTTTGSGKTKQEAYDNMLIQYAEIKADRKRYHDKNVLPKNNMKKNRVKILSSKGLGGRFPLFKTSGRYIDVEHRKIDKVGMMRRVRKAEKRQAAREERRANNVV